MKTPIIFAPEKGKISLETIDLPPLNANQILFQNQLSAISPGTELAWLHHKPNTPGHYPFYLGYSACGIVSEIGEAVKDFQIGQRVVTNVRHAAYAVVEAERCIPIPDSLPDAYSPQAWGRTEPAIDWETAFVRELRHFHDCIVHGTACRTSIEDARADIRLIIDMIKRYLA